MASPSVQPSVHKLRLYLHMVPVLGILPSLFLLYDDRRSGRLRAGNRALSNRTLSNRALSNRALYGDPVLGCEEYRGEADGATLGNLPGRTAEQAQLRAVSRQSVMLGASCISAMILLWVGAGTQPSQVGTIRFLLASSFVGSGYFLVSLGLMFRLASDRSIRLPGISQLSRRLP